MDYESILFGLQPLLNADPIDEIPIQDVYLQSYLTVLDQLAVSLRSHSNRDVVGHSGLLSNLLRVLNGVLDITFHKDGKKLPWLILASELIRCIANAVVDNDTNRELVMGDLKKKNEIIDYYIGRILKMVDLIDNEKLLTDLQTRSIVFIKNLCLESETYTTKCSESLRGSLWTYVVLTQRSYPNELDSNILGSELLNEFIQVNYKGFNIDDISFLSIFIERVTQRVENKFEEPQNEEAEISITTDKTTVMANVEDEIDPNVELALNLVMCLEHIVSNDMELNFGSSPELTTSIQTKLFDSIELLTQKEFNNKLIIMRRLVSSVGYISAAKSNSNKSEQTKCIHLLKDSKEGYPLAAGTIVLSNSISSRQDSDDILKQIQLAEIFSVANYFKDPMQYQGYLDLLKKVLNITNGMFVSEEELVNLSFVIKICHDQSKYFTNLAGLLDSFLNKLLVVVPSSTIQKLVINEPNSIFFEVIKERGSLTVCLLLDKLLVAKTPVSDGFIAPLFASAFKFQESSLATTGNGTNVSLPFLFQLTKTIGIYLRNCNLNKQTDVLIFDRHSSELVTLLKSIQTLQQSTDKGGKSTFNNGKYVAGMIINLLKLQEILTAEEISLHELSKSFFITS